MRYDYWQARHLQAEGVGRRVGRPKTRWGEALTLGVVIVTAYLLGSFPTSYVLVHQLTGRDIRTMGSGNPGTMNVLDSVGFWPAVFVGLTDISKGMAAGAIAYTAGLDDSAAILAIVAAMFGHNFSIFLRFDGGHGTAAGIGGAFILLPLETLSAGIAGLLVAIALQNRRIGGLFGMALLPVLGTWWGAPDVRVYGGMLLVVLAILVIARDEGFHLSPVRTRHDR